VVNGRAFFTVFSEPKNFDLEEGEETQLDVDNDGKKDIHVRAASVDAKTGKTQVVVTMLEAKGLSINDNATHTQSRQVTLRIKEVEGVTQMAISEDPDFTGASYETYVPSRVYTLSDGLGEKTVYIRLRKSTGAIALVTDSIILAGDSQTGCVLTVGKAYKTATSPAVYMVTEAHSADGSLTGGTCTKRAFTNATIFFSYFNSWDQVQVDNSISNISNDALGFMPWGPQYDPQYGALVKTVSDPKVYLLLDGDKFWITSESVFSALNYQWYWIEDVATTLLEKYTTKTEITNTDKHPNYTLIKYADSPRVYRLEPSTEEENKTVKRYIPDEATFEALKYRWDRIVTVPDSEQYIGGKDLSRE